MEEDTLGFLDQSAAPVTTPAVETPEKPTAVETPEKPAVAAEVVQPSTPAAPEKTEEKQVPLATFLDMRDQLKEAKDKLKALEVGNDFVPPDPSKDPEGYFRYQESVIHLNIMNDRLHTSERFAVKEHGKDIVEKAREWALQKFSEDPAYEQRVLNLQDPYETVINDFNNHQLLQELTPAEVKAYREWKAAQAQGQQPNGGASPAAIEPAKSVVETKPAAKPKPQAPKSIAGVPASGGGTHAMPVGEGQAFDSLFQGR